MQRVIFDDIETTSSQLFANTTSILSGSSSSSSSRGGGGGGGGDTTIDATEQALETMLYTLEDYFVYFQTRIHPRPFLRLMSLCYNQMLCLYIKR